MSKQFFQNYTKSSLLSIFLKLKDYSVKKSWSKSKLLSHLVEYTNQDILDVFTSNELKEGLEILGASTSGNKKSRYNRLLKLISVQSQTKSTTSSLRNKKSITLEGFEVPLKAKVELTWSGPELEYRAWGDWSSVYVDSYSDLIQEVAESWVNAGGSIDGLSKENFDLVHEWYVQDLWDGAEGKEHLYVGCIKASWKSIEKMLSMFSPSLLSYATKMRIILGKHAVLELTRFRIPDDSFGTRE